MAVVLVVAAGGSWEPSVVALLEQHPSTVLLKRCVDVDELLAAAATGQADAALVGIDAPGLDAHLVAQLHHHGLRTVAVVPTGAAADSARARATRIGIGRVVPEDQLDSLPEALDAAVAPQAASPPSPIEPGTGRVIAVWGPSGAPGRTTVAAALAAELARRQLSTLLIDADPYGGSVAQQLGILDEVSGLLQAARLQASRELAPRLVTAVRSLGRYLGVVTGLPRPERWTDARRGLIAELVSVGARAGHVVLDTGFSLEDDQTATMTGRVPRNQLTLEALEVADELVVVGTADPVGLTRLARGLVDLHELLGPKQAHVVVNRMRPSLGWTERDIAGMVAGVTTSGGVHFLPEDRASVDKALVAGRTLLETAADGPLPRALVPLVDALLAVEARSTAGS